jgi:hypothetical protein
MAVLPNKTIFTHFKRYARGNKATGSLLTLDSLSEASSLERSRLLGRELASGCNYRKLRQTGQQMAAPPRIAFCHPGQAKREPGS